MILRIKYLLNVICYVVCFCVLSVQAHPHEETSEQNVARNNNTNVEVQRIAAKAEQLAEEVKRLETEIQTLKQQQYHLQHVSETHHEPSPRPNNQTNNQNKPAKIPEARFIAHDADVHAEAYHPSSHYLARKGITYWGGTPVLASPYLGIRTQYDGTDLIVNFSTINKDLALLQMKQTFEKVLAQEGKPLPEHPLVELSGLIQMQWHKQCPYCGGHKSDIDLTDAEIDLVGIVNHWVTGFMTVVYDNGSGSSIRVKNSRFFLDNGFFTIGNLNICPLYLTAGQYYVPFGQFSSNMISNSLPKILGRTKARAITLGYHKSTKGGPYAALFKFRGETKEGGSVTTGNDRINRWGANLGYKQSGNNWSFDVAVAFIDNLAESLGMQCTGASEGFDGFAMNTATERLTHDIPGVDVRGNFGFDHFNIIAEYVGAKRSFDPANLTINCRGARPEAWHYEASYMFKIRNRPSTIAISYDQSRAALALNLPRQRYMATLSTSIWPDTVQSLEYRHDCNYGKDTRATGQGIAWGPIGSLGKTEDTITAQMNVYF